jgi:hypothetical protein
MDTRNSMNKYFDHSRSPGVNISCVMLALRVPSASWPFFHVTSQQQNFEFRSRLGGRLLSYFWLMLQKLCIEKKGAVDSVMWQNLSVFVNWISGGQIYSPLWFCAKALKAPGMGARYEGRGQKDGDYRAYSVSSPVNKPCNWLGGPGMALQGPCNRGF